jgi:Zn-dependent protease
VDAVAFGTSLAAYLFSLSVHESAHAYTALKLGDATGAALGRISLNPIRHIDPFGTVLLPLVLWFGSHGQFMFGYAKPVPYNPYRLKNPPLGSAAISAAGPLSNLLLAFASAVVLKVAAGAGVFTDSIGWKLFVSMIWLNLALAFFNLLPIPPLDGGGILLGILPRRASMALDRLRPYGFLVLVLLMVTGVTGRILLPVMFHSIVFLQRFVGAPLV